MRVLLAFIVLWNGFAYSDDPLCILELAGQKPVGLILRDLRETRRISQSEIALRLKTTQSAISKFESSGDANIQTALEYLHFVDPQAVFLVSFRFNNHTIHVKIKRNQNLGFLLAQFRRNFEITQIEIANRISVKQPVISKLENQGSNLRISTLLSYFSGLGVSPRIQIKR